MESTLLSVLVITYNQESTIAKTIESIVSQKTQYPFKLIISDDASSDKTPDIIRQYEAKYENINCIINKNNMGAIKNYYNALSFCKSTFIMECAGDDYWLPNKIEKQMNIMISNPDIGMSYSAAKVQTDGEIIENKLSGTGDYTTFEKLLQGNGIPTPTVCMRRDVVDAYLRVIHPDEKPWIMEDYPMWLWISKNSKIERINDILAVYSINTESVSHSDNYLKEERFAENVHKIGLYYAENNLRHIKMTNRLYYHYMCNISLKHKQLNSYRKYLSRELSLKALCKIILSYSEYGRRILRKEH